MNPGYLMNQSITVARVTGRNSYGDPIFGASSALAARVQPMNRIVRGPNGQELLADTVVYTLTAIDLQDRVWLPGANTADPKAARAPITSSAHVDGRGTAQFYKAEF